MNNSTLVGANPQPTETVNFSYNYFNPETGDSTHVSKTISGDFLTHDAVMETYLKFLSQAGCLLPDEFRF